AGSRNGRLRNVFMMPTHKLRENLFKRRFRGGAKQPGLWLTLESTTATEVLAGSGYDWLLLDMEHTTVDPSQIAAHVRAAHGGTAELVVRIPWNEPIMVKRLLDAGVRSLMFPCVQSGAEAAAAVAATRYPPHGIRGVSGNMRANSFARVKDYAQTYRDEQCVIVQLESPKAIAAIEEIAAVDGVDALFIGPNDLAATMGYFGQPGAPEVKALITAAIPRINRTGKAAGILNYNIAEARALFKAGVDFIAVNSDTGILARHSEAILAQVKADE
ncbi:MAG: aldolase/citrate lyase family protein, partial [Casimicrobiaceae bacterium]